MVPFPDTSKLSAIAGELERRYPNASLGEIYAMAKPAVENALAVATGQPRSEGIFFAPGELSEAASVLFSAPILGDTAAANSIHSQLNSARHTPVPPETATFRQTPRLSSQRHPQPQPQPQAQHAHQLTTRQPETTPYDIDSWFNTFPSSNTGGTSSEFTSFQVRQSVSLSYIRMRCRHILNNPISMEESCRVARDT
jgi:hypothetical protein